MISKPVDDEIFTTVAVRVTPRAKKSEIQQVLEDGTIKVRLTTPPVDGKANQSLIKLLAGIFRINSSQIEIISGRNNRNKLVRITGVSPETVKSKIEANLG